MRVNSGQNKGQKSEITGRILNLLTGKNEKLPAQKQYFINIMPFPAIVVLSFYPSSLGFCV